MTDRRGPAGSARHAELAAFLRARRAALRPADVGLTEPAGAGRRRTPGLRREEVAQLSGVGLTWYTWLEQGRGITPSVQVLDALARALMLDPDQRRHLHDLAGLSVPLRPAPIEELLPRLQRLVDAVSPNIACDKRLAEIVAGLSAASPQFRRWWTEYPIREFRPATIHIDHPRAGPIALEMFQTRLVEHPDLLLVMQVPASGDDLRRVTTLINCS